MAVTIAQMNRLVRVGGFALDPILLGLILTLLPDLTFVFAPGSALMFYLCWVDCNFLCS